MLEQAELSLLLVDRWLGLSISSLRFACKTNPAPMSSSISNFYTTELAKYCRVNNSGPSSLYTLFEEWDFYLC